MKAKDFYDKMACKELYSLQKMHLSENKRPFILESVVRKMCDDISKNKKSEDILNEISEYLTYAYKNEWFAFLWQKQEQIQYDVKVLERFLKWFYLEEHKIKKILPNINCCIPLAADVSEKMGSDSMTAFAHLVITYSDGTYTAFCIKWYQTRFSPSGRSVHTKLHNSLELRLLKQSLEPKYPGIRVGYISLRTDADVKGELVSEFHADPSKGKKANIQIPNWSSYQEGKIFRMQDFMEDTAYVLKQPVLRQCSNCLQKELCKIPNFRSSGKGKIIAKQGSKEAYIVPEFSKEQLQAVNTVEGPLIVLAGPGSGKTAVLTGRVLAMKKAGIHMSHLLIITFAKKAATELQYRIFPYCEDEQPYISTLNSLGYDILLNNQKAIGKVSFASEVELKVLLKSVLESCEPIQGISYSSVNRYEPHGLYDNVYRKIGEYASLGEVAFFEKHPEIGQRQFSDVYNCFMELKKAKGMVTYSEQISLAIRLLKDRPDILKQYHGVFRYIMVDEFQDISDEQMEFINILLGPTNRNLCVVGDDDQSIYGFRGGTNKYMLEFSKTFSDAKTVILRENYRSSVGIVQACQSVIQNNVERLKKEIFSAKKTSIYPKLYRDADIEKLGKIIAHLHEEGFKYQDIAILAKRNNPLSELFQLLDVPCMTSHNCLIEDKSFLIARMILKIHFSGLVKDRDFFQFTRMFSQERSLALERFESDFCESVIKEGSLHPLNDSAYYMENIDVFSNPDTDAGIIARLSIGMEFVKQLNPSELVSQIARVYLDDADSKAGKMLEELCKEKQFKDMFALYRYMDYMYLFKDDTRIEYEDETDAVQLMTAHDSKGKQFPCVIIWNAGEFDDSEESRRLLYVAMTRAEQCLYICKERGTARGNILDIMNIEEGGIL